MIEEIGMIEEGMIEGMEMIEEEMHSSIRRISRPIAREEVIKGFQEFAENFRNAGVQKGSFDEKLNSEIEKD